MNCHNCGTLLEPDVKFCSGCGIMTVAGVAQKKADSLLKWAFWVNVACVLMSALGFVLTVFFFNMLKGSPVSSGMVRGVILDLAGGVILSCLFGTLLFGKKAPLIIRRACAALCGIYAGVQLIFFIAKFVSVVHSFVDISPEFYVKSWSSFPSQIFQLINLFLVAALFLLLCLRFAGRRELLPFSVVQVFIFISMGLSIAIGLLSFVTLTNSTVVNGEMTMMQNGLQFNAASLLPLVPQLLTMFALREVYRRLPEKERES